MKPLNWCGTIVIVADASVVVAALVDSATSGDLARQRLVSEHVAAPDLMYVEVASALRSLERAGKLSANRAEAALDDLLDLPVEVASHRELIAASWPLRHNLTAYDALYVTLAHVGGATLVTADRPMALAAKGRCRVDLIAAAS